MIIRGNISSYSINLGNTNNVKFQAISNSVKYNIAKQGDSVDISKSGRIMYANMKQKLGSVSNSIIEIKKFPREIIEDALGLHNSYQHVALESLYEMKRIENGAGDSVRLNLLGEIKNDLIKMEKNAHKYYEKHGTLDGLSNEELSQGTGSMEYKDIALIKDVSKELGQITRGQFKSDLEYYDAVLEKIFDSNLSDKAKKSVGGYIEHLKKESVKEVKLSVDDSLSVREIEKQLARIKEKINKDNTKVNWNEVHELNKKFTNIYLNYH